MTAYTDPLCKPDGGDVCHHVLHHDGYLCPLCRLLWGRDIPKPGDDGSDA